MTETRATFQLTKKLLVPSGAKPKTILRQKSLAVNVFYDGKNLTPKPLNPEVCRNIKERQISIYEESSISFKDSSSTGAVGYEAPKSTLRFRTEVHGGADTFQGSIFHGSADFLEPSYPSERGDETEDGSAAESELVFGVPSIESLTGPKMKKAPTHISLILSETKTFFILDIPSCTALKDTEEGDIAEANNKYYEYLTEGKGRNRKVVNAEAQTTQILKKTRNTVAEVVKSKSSPAFASNWEMFDTYHEEKNKSVDNSSESDDE